MSAPPLLRARLIGAEASLQERFALLAREMGFELEVSAEAPAANARVSDGAVWFWCDRGAADAVAARVTSVSGMQPDVPLVVVVAAPRSDVDAALLRAGAFDVLDDGPELAVHLRRTLAAARRVLSLQGERARLYGELSHQDRLAALGLLAAGVSHEINNPVCAILSNVGALRDQLEGVLARPRYLRTEALEEHSADWLESLGDCVAAARRIESIVRTLNVFSRRAATESAVVDVNEEVHTVLRLIGREVRFQARFDVELDPDLPRVVVPANAVTQIVTNLVVNALQALEDVPVPNRWIGITTSFDDEAVMLEVADSGPGVPADIAGRIFDPFFTTKGVGKGTGLGLAITRELVQRCNGEIFLDPGPGQGARFRVLLERPALEAAPPRRASLLPPAHDRLRVLVVDDDELTLRSIQRSLGPHFDCTLCVSGDEALSRLATDADYDAILCDVVMPGMSGFDVFTALRDRYPLLETRFAFSSGGITADALRSRVRESGRPVFPKPMDPAEMVRALRALGRGLDAWP